MFDISFFRENPYPFYALAQELYPGKFRPTIAHSFIRLLHKRKLLLKAFTQNIDCLEREAGVPDEAIVEAHGSFATQRCIECKTEYPDDLMKKAVEGAYVPTCLTPNCNGLVKPDIVFFGEQLPEKFFHNRTLTAQADLCIVMGTSLSVQPFASLPVLCPEGAPRLLINKERVGGLGSRADDVLLLGDCDEGVRRLASALGWLPELEALWKETGPREEPEGDQPAKSKDEVLEDEISKLTEEVEKSLKVSHETIDWLQRHVDDETEKKATESEKKQVNGQPKHDIDQLSSAGKTETGTESSPKTPAEKTDSSLANEAALDPSKVLKIPESKKEDTEDSHNIPSPEPKSEV